MKKRSTQNEIRNTKYEKAGVPRFAYLVSRIPTLDQLGVAPLVFLAVSGIFLAGVLLFIATQTLNLKNPLATPVPSGMMIGNAIIASPIPVDPNDPALCDDEYNADCDNSEGDDVDPADLAGPD
jgi:hypothetical protein